MEFKVKLNGLLLAWLLWVIVSFIISLGLVLGSKPSQIEYAFLLILFLWFLQLCLGIIVLGFAFLFSPDEKKEA